ncbi:MAG TPA: hypothetical protein VNU00_04045 [Candidatus Binataceae bacterium]|jgi:uncharacterized membrane protein|nr:hypothetical protein [Candidatus Binataceae bacterium]
METTTNPQSRPIAAVSYLLFFVSGLILLNVDPYDKDDYIRFHARQSILFSVAWVAVLIVFGVFVAVLPYSLGNLLRGIESLINLGLAVFWVFLMYKAFTGARFRIPYMADWADGMGF